MNNLEGMHICDGACQMIGAASAFLSMKDAAVIFNSPRWCALTAERELTMPRLHYEERLYCTEVREDTLVYGVEASLKETLDEVYAEYTPPLIAVVTSCSMSLIGDDVKAICQRYSKKAEIIALDAGGLTGGFASGYEKAQLELLRLTDFTACSQSVYVNILGASTAYPHWQGDLAEIKRLLKSCGIDVNIVFGVDLLSVAELNRLGAARMNVVVDTALGLSAAKWLKDNRQMEYIEASWPYGLQESIDWLKKIAQALAIKVDFTSIQKEATIISNCIAEQCAYIEHDLDDCYISQIIFSLPQKRALNIAQAFYASKIDLLHCKNFFIKDLLDVSFEQNNSMYHTWHDVSEIPDITSDKIRLLLASDRERFLLGKYANTVYLNLHSPLPRLCDIWNAYVGIRGWMNLVNTICEQIVTLKFIGNNI